MCTVVVLLRPGRPWPVLIAANRDEMLNRPWRPPARHWPDRPEVVAGLDELAGGSWLGINRFGVVAAILNRHGSLGPAQGMRSRGELVLEALDHADARDAAHALSQIDARAYRSFNMMVADNVNAYWLRNLGTGATDRVEPFALPPGLSMLTAFDRNDTASPRIRDYLPRFEAAPIPDPDAGDWAAWQALLASRGPSLANSDEAGDNRESGMSIVTEFGFGTSSSSLIALPAVERVGTHPRWLFAGGRPGTVPYQPIEL